MPFGLRNAPAVFQALMEKVLRDYIEFSSVYIDDVLVYSDCWEDHLKHVKAVLAVRQTGLMAKPSKCQWGKQYLEFLGHRGGCGKVAVPQYRTEDMAQFKRPITKRDLCAYLGSVGYYRCFVQGFANSSALLTPATAKTAPGRVVWTQEMLDAFHTLRESLCSQCVLTVPCV